MSAPSRPHVLLSHVLGAPCPCIACTASRLRPAAIAPVSKRVLYAGPVSGGRMIAQRFRPTGAEPRRAAVQAAGNEWSDEQAAMLECTLMQEVEARDSELAELRQAMSALR